jgi:hypothetical protein
MLLGFSLTAICATAANYMWMKRENRNKETGKIEWRVLEEPDKDKMIGLKPIGFQVSYNR